MQHAFLTRVYEFVEKHAGGLALRFALVNDDVAADVERAQERVRERAQERVHERAQERVHERAQEQVQGHRHRLVRNRRGCDDDRHRLLHLHLHLHLHLLIWHD